MTKKIRQRKFKFEKMKQLSIASKWEMTLPYHTYH